MPISDAVIRQLRSYFLSSDRKNVVSGDIKPDTTGTINLGSPTKKFKTVYADRIVASSLDGGASSGGTSTEGHADTLGDDYLTASDVPTIGELFPLVDDGSGNPVVPDSVLPSDVAFENTSPIFTSISVTNYVDGVDISNHDHTGGTAGPLIAHGTLTGLGGDDHPLYTRWDSTEKIIKEWKFTNIAEENHDFDEYVGWSIESSVALSGDPPEPDKSTAQAVIKTLAFSDPNHPSYEHAYPLRIIAHAEYSAIQMGSVSSPALELRNDDSDISLTLGNVFISNASGIDVNNNFLVDTNGNLTAKSGYIGSEADGWEILTDKLQGSGGNVVLDNDGLIKLANPNDKKVLISSYDFSSDPNNNYRLWVGDYGASTHTETTADFVVTTSGSVVANSLGVKGLLQSWGTDKWSITSDGNATFQSVDTRGRLETVVLAKATVSSISGTFSLNKGATFAQDVGTSDTTIYLDDSIFAYGDIVLVQPSANKIEWMLITSQPSLTQITNEDGETVYVFEYSVTRDYNSEAGTTYEFSQGTAVNGRGAYAGGNSPHPLASGDPETAYGDYQPAGAYSGSGGGWLTLSGEEGYIGVDVRTGPLPKQFQQLIRIGNLQGWLDYGGVEWGFGVGDANDYFTYDQTNGLRIFSRSGVTQIDASGIVSDSMRLSKETSPEPADLPTDSSQIYFDGTDLIFKKDVSGSESIHALATETYINTYVSNNSINNVVEDTTPQLGGNLDGQTYSINNVGTLSLEEITFSGVGKLSTVFADFVYNANSDASGGSARYRFQDGGVDFAELNTSGFTFGSNTFIHSGHSNYYTRTVTLTLGGAAGISSGDYVEVPHIGIDGTIIAWYIHANASGSVTTGLDYASSPGGAYSQIEDIDLSSAQSNSQTGLAHAVVADGMLRLQADSDGTTLTQIAVAIVIEIEVK